MFQLPQFARRDIIHDPMHLQPALLGRSDDIRVFAKDIETAGDISLDQAKTLVLVAEGLPALVAGQVAAQGADRQEPGVEQAEAGVAEGGVDAAAEGVAGDDDVLDFQVHDGVGDDGGGGDVACVQHVGDVAVHEDIAGFAAEEGRLGHARVGAADPEDRGRLALGELGEEIRVLVRQG